MIWGGAQKEAGEGKGRDWKRAGSIGREAGEVQGRVRRINQWMSGEGTSGKVWKGGDDGRGGKERRGSVSHYRVFGGGICDSGVG